MQQCTSHQLIQQQPCISGGRQHANTETGIVTKRNKSKLKLIAMKFWELFWEKQEGTEQEMKFLNTEYRMWK